MYYTEEREFFGLIDKNNFYGFKSDFVANFFSRKN